MDHPAGEYEHRGFRENFYTSGIWLSLQFKTKSGELRLAWETSSGAYHRT